MTKVAWRRALAHHPFGRSDDTSLAAIVGLRGTATSQSTCASATGVPRDVFQPDGSIADVGATLRYRWKDWATGRAGMSTAHSLDDRSSAMTAGSARRTMATLPPRPTLSYTSRDDTLGESPP